MITPEQIKELRDLQTKATPIPWRVCGANNNECSCHLIWSVPADDVIAASLTDKDILFGGGQPPQSAVANARLIAAAVTALPELLDEIERLESEIVTLQIENGGCF